MYTFKQAKYDDYINQLNILYKEHNIRPSDRYIVRLFDKEETCCPSGEYCALILGKIWSLFGGPFEPDVSEDFYFYVISAEDEDGNILYLDIYEYSGMPSVSAPEPNSFKTAVDELVKLIMEAEPADYEWNGTYEDYDVGIKYSAKNGVAYYEDDFGVVCCNNEK